MNEKLKNRKIRKYAQIYSPDVDNNNTTTKKPTYKSTQT